MENSNFNESLYFPKKKWSKPNLIILNIKKTNEGQGTTFDGISFSGS